MPGKNFDVCVVFAVDEEFDAFVRVLLKMYRQTIVQMDRGRNGRPYKYAMIQNEAGKNISLHLSLALDQGPQAMTAHLKDVLAEFEPSFIAMTGFCAGDPRKVKLGDLIVAERAFLYETGSAELGDAGESEFRPDPFIYRPDATTLSQVRLFDGWQTKLKDYTSRPPSRKQQSDWLLDQLSQMPEMNVKKIPAENLKQHVPEWRSIVTELQRGSEPWLSKDLILIRPECIEELRYGSEEFPFRDGEPRKPHIKVMASGHAVRHDNPFKSIQGPVRSAVAVDMEAATLYQVVGQDYPTLARLVVKGVCDYASPEKDDKYHEYAAEAAAVYLLCFLREYISGSTHVEAKPEPIKNESVPEDIPSEACHIYCCCAPKDLPYLKELEKHLSIYIRSKRLAFWWTYDTTMGKELHTARAHYKEHAQIVLVLISPDLMSNVAAIDEIQYFANLHARDQTRVIPVRLRQTASWKDIPFIQDDTLGSIMGLPSGSDFMVVNGTMNETSFMNVAREVWKLCNPRR